MALLLYRYVRGKYPRKEREQDTHESPTTTVTREVCKHQRIESYTSEAGLVTGTSHNTHELDDLTSAVHKSQHVFENTTVNCNLCKEEKESMSHYRRRLMLGLFFPFLVQSLDTTIIAGALPFIASEFRKSCRNQSGISTDN